MINRNKPDPSLRSYIWVAVLVFVVNIITYFQYGITYHIYLNAALAIFIITVSIIRKRQKVKEASQKGSNIP